MSHRRTKCFVSQPRINKNWSLLFHSKEREWSFLRNDIRRIDLRTGERQRHFFFCLHIKRLSRRTNQPTMFGGFSCLGFRGTTGPDRTVEEGSLGKDKKKVQKIKTSEWHRGFRPLPEKRNQKLSSKSTTTVAAVLEVSDGGCYELLLLLARS